ncbi:CocE/NonD family hydrolase [Paenarthrobacter sp.]|uniref:CocE/NonD family hydrolase n=1 Tax=Paenarthrobacter sp. TaxID=1931993 RepID=UPI0028125137|nr:CocE/NonD family hydrolase [Paenarthrobacter sp.]
MIPATGAHSLQIYADDGVRLATDHYRSSTEETALGTVLIRTPYGRTKYAEQAKAWTRAGYDAVIQDVRGRYGSGGEWHPYVSEGRDGAATAKQLVSNNYFRGPLILAGASYDAHAAVEAARVLEMELVLRTAAGPVSSCVPVAVVAMVPALGLYETARHPDGTPRFQDRIGWWHRHGFDRTSAEALSPAELQRRYRQAEELGMGWVLQGLVRDAEYGSGAGDKWRQLWDAPPLDLQNLYGKLNTPLLMISGQRDFFVAEALALARAWGGAASGSVVQTIWGPWGHGLARDLDTGAAAALREQGGLMARIKDFLAVAGGCSQSATADGPRPPALQWQPDDHSGAWGWTPATTDSLQLQ